MSSAPRSTFEVLHEEPGFGLASWGHVVVSILVREPTVPVLERIGKAQDRSLAQYDKIAPLSILRQLPGFRVDDKVRRHSAAMVTEYSPRFTGAAVVIEADGVRAAIIRSIVTGVGLLGRSKSPMIAFPSVAKGTAWLLGRPETPEVYVEGAEELIAGVAALSQSTHLEPQEGPRRATGPADLN